MTIEIATAPEAVIDTPRKKLKQKMRGFTLIELGIVLTIVAILALFAVPRVQGYLIGGKVQPTATEIGAAVGRIRANASANAAAAQPYVGIGIDALARALDNRANALIPTVAALPANSTVLHRLGANGANTAVAALQTGLAAAGGAAGDSFSITFNTVSDAACPEFASALQAQTEITTINGTTVKSTVNSVNANATAYNGTTAQAACAAGNNNTFVFTFR